MNNHVTGNIRIGLVDLGALWELAIGLQTSGLVGVVLENDISLFVLVIAEREKDDISLVDPDLLTKLSTDMSQALLPVETESL